MPTPTEEFRQEPDDPLEAVVPLVQIMISYPDPSPEVVSQPAQFSDWLVGKKEDLRGTFFWTLSHAALALDELFRAENGLPPRENRPALIEDMTRRAEEDRARETLGFSDWLDARRREVCDGISSSDARRLDPQLAYLKAIAVLDSRFRREKDLPPR